MKKLFEKFKTFLNHFLNDDLTRKEFVVGALVIFALKLILVCTQMIQIFPGNAPIDDELMFYAAQSIGRGEWLGPYSWATIAKSMGFSVWLWLLHTLHIPYLLGNQLLYAGACVLAANALAPVAAKRRTRFFIILVLWFSPFATAQFTLRVYRDSILPALILYAFAGVIGFCLRVKDDRKDSVRYALAGGFFTGFSRLVRDDVIWIYPFVVCATMAYGLFAFFSKDVKDRGKKIFSTLAVAGVSFAVPILLFCALNYHFYGVFLINETNDPDFTAAISAMQRADLDLPHAGVAVCHDTRMRIYQQVPEAAELGVYLENQRYSIPEESEYNSGGFLWAVKKAAYNAGFTPDGKEAKRYFRSLADAINKAYEDGRLKENEGIKVISAFLMPYDSSFLVPTVKEVGNSLKCILFFEQTSSLAPLSYATSEQARLWQQYTYTMPSYKAVPNTADPHYYFPQLIAEWIYGCIRWCYRLLIWPALFLGMILFFRELKKSMKEIRSFFSRNHTMSAILMLGVVLSILVRIVLMSYIEVTSFRIGTYLLYLSGAAVLVIYLAAVGATYGLEKFLTAKCKKQGDI